MYHMSPTGFGSRHQALQIQFINVPARCPLSIIRLWLAPATYRTQTLREHTSVLRCRVRRPTVADENERALSLANSQANLAILVAGWRPAETGLKCAPTPTRPRTQERSAPLAPRAVASQIDPGHFIRPKRSSFDHPEAISPRCTDLAPGVLDNGLVKVTSHL